MKTFNLHYFINSTSDISLNPVDSDTMANAIVMKHLIGTLVKFANGGQYKPYLAKKYKSTNEGKTWHFTLNESLSCENGEPITAVGYINGLKKVLKLYSQNGDLPIFSDLTGWNSYLKGEDLVGLEAISSHEILFKFEKPVNAGFLEYLSMPYYGYFCSANFKNDIWKNNLIIYSSNSYSIAEKPLQNSRLFTLNKRGDWKLKVDKAPEHVIFSTEISKKSWNIEHAVIQTNLSFNEITPVTHTEVMGPPDIIRNIVLDPSGPSHFFQDIQHRKLLQFTINKVKSEEAFNSKTATLAKGFYPIKEDFQYTSINNYFKPTEKLKIYIPHNNNPDINYVIDLLKESLKTLKWDYELFVSGSTPNIQPIDSQSRTKFDIRISGVVAGSIVEPWVVDMMFASNQGVSYPDPSGRVTKLAHELMTVETPNLLEANEIISKYIFEDAAVIPIYHSHNTWYFTKDLDLSQVSGDIILPNFDEIGIL